MPDAEVVLLDLQLDDGFDPLVNAERFIEASYKVLDYSIADNVRLLRRALAGGAAGVCRKVDLLASTISSIEAVTEGPAVVSRRFWPRSGVTLPTRQRTSDRANQRCWPGPPVALRCRRSPSDSRSPRTA